MYTQEKKSANFIGIEDKNQKIYRIFSREFFQDIITANRLTLVNPSKWKDKKENFYLKGPRVIDNTPVSQQALYDSWYCQSWTCTINSKKIWEEHSPNRSGICLSTTIQKLFGCLYDPEDPFASITYFIGKVKYLTKEQIQEIKETPFEYMMLGGQNDAFAEALCVKDKHYSFEHEIRLLAGFSTEKNRGVNGDFSISCSQNIFDEVYLDPRLNSSESENQKQILTQIGCSLPFSTLVWEELGE